MAAGLRAAHPGALVELVIVSTEGDRDRDRPLWEIGGKGVFVKEVEAALLEGRADVAVHSGKDLPAGTPDGLVIAAVPERADPRDALVGAGLDDIPTGGLVATGSVRRRAQLAHRRPDLTFAEIRGNIDTRLAAAGQFDAVVLAMAGLQRLERLDSVAEPLDPSVIVPQVAQGALAIECRVDDGPTREALELMEHAPSRRVFDAERSFLAELGGDCDLPAGAHAILEGGDIRITGILASLDGHQCLRREAIGDEPEPLGRQVARHLLDNGGEALL